MSPQAAALRFFPATTTSVLITLASERHVFDPLPDRAYFIAVELAF